MQGFSLEDWRQRLAFAGLLVIVCLQLMSLTSSGQNLRQQPATGKAVQGQTAAQAEGAVVQLCVLRLGFVQDGDVGIGVFPEGKKVLVSGEGPHAGVGRVSAL